MPASAGVNDKARAWSCRCALFYGPDEWAAVAAYSCMVTMHAVQTTRAFEQDGLKVSASLPVKPACSNQGQARMWRSLHFAPQRNYRLYPAAAVTALVSARTASPAHTRNWTNQGSWLHASPTSHATYGDAPYFAWTALPRLPGRMHSVQHARPRWCPHSALYFWRRESGIGIAVVPLPGAGQPAGMAVQTSHRPASKEKPACGFYAGGHLAARPTGKVLRV